jgi:drug/metabolite transporter (DMT)-like permease
LSRRGWALFVALGIIWGIPYLFIKIAVEDLSPAAVVFGRTVLAAVLLLPLAAARRQLRPLLPAWRWLLLFAALEVCAPFLLLTVAEQQISSSLTGLLVAAVPLLQAVFTRLFGVADRLDRRRLGGLLVGLAGVAALVGIDVRGGSLLAAGAVLLAAACYAAGPLVAAVRLTHLPGLAVSAVAMGLSALVYAPFAAVSAPARLSDVDPAAWIAVGVLGAVCSAVAFLVFFALLAEVGPSRTTVITYVNPAVAVLLGVLALGEPLTPGLLVGFPLVLVGSYLATRRSPSAGMAPAEGVGAVAPTAQEVAEEDGRDSTGASSSERTTGSATRRSATAVASAASAGRPPSAGGSSSSSSSSSSGASSSGTSS